MTARAALARFIRALPKAELHLHIEGSLEPDMMFAFGARHGVALPYASVEAVRAAYRFSDLQSFLDIYYAGAAVLRERADFRDLTLAYLRRAHADGVVHAEIFFDPQTHTARGIPFAAVVDGITDGLAAGERECGISSRLIMCFLRHLSEEDAFATLEAAVPFLGGIAGVGLDSSEAGNPPEKFARVFARAAALGLRRVAHAGEEGPPQYIADALDLLGAVRIDHGVACERDDALVERLARERVPLTVCPLSNTMLQVFARMEDHNLKRLLDRGLCVTVNSDDPAYFGGYLLDNYVAVAEALALGPADLRRLAANSIEAAWIDPIDRRRHLAAIDAVPGPA
jgi:adenosine deaminase